MGRSQRRARWQSSPGAALTAAFMALPCQAVHGAGATAEGYTLEPVIITPGKRSENILDVPASVWVATASTLERSLARDFDDLVRLAPSLTVTKTSQPANNSINIRGVGTYAFSIAARPSVSVVVDDVPQAFQAQAFATLADVDQLEVLRGPQSTLFGTSATAGVISIRTRAPTSTFTVGGRMMSTDDGEQRASGHVSGPLADTLKGRLFVAAASWRGNLRNIHTGHWVNGHDDFTAQAKLLWEPAPDWSVTLASRWNETQGTCCTSAAYFLSPGVSFGRFQGYSAPQVAVLAGIVPGRDNRRIAADVDPRADATDRGASLKLEHQAGGFSLAWITGINRYDLEDLQDTDGSAFNWGPGGAALPGAIEGGSANGGSFRVDAISSELRVASPAEDRLRYVAGLIFNRIGADRSFIRGSNGLMQYGTLATVPATGSAWSTYQATAHARSFALFGTATFDVTRRLGVVTGLRLNREELDYSLHDRVNQVRYGDPHCSSATPSGLQASSCDDFDALTGKGALTFRLSPSVMLFGSYDRGYKSAAYDLTSTYTTRSAVTAPGPLQGYPVADAVAAQQPVAPETVDSWQLGIKGSLHERLNLGLTLFDATFHDYQAQSRDELTRQNILNSVEKVRTRGVELEIAARPADWLTLNAAGAYNDAFTARFTNVTCYASQTAALGCVNGMQDLSGQPLSNAPRWTFNLDAGAGLAAGGSRVTFDAGFHWQSKVLYSLVRDPQSRQAGYGILNLAVGLRRGAWDLKAFVVNALDRNHALSRSRDGNWNINPHGASAGPVTDAVKWAPGRDSARYFGISIGAGL